MNQGLTFNMLNAPSTTLDRAKQQDILDRIVKDSTLVDLIYGNVGTFRPELRSLMARHDRGNLEWATYEKLSRPEDSVKTMLRHACERNVLRLFGTAVANSVPTLANLLHASEAGFLFYGMGVGAGMPNPSDATSMSSTTMLEPYPPFTCASASEPNRVPKTLSELLDQPRYRRLMTEICLDLSEDTPKTMKMPAWRFLMYKLAKKFHFSPNLAKMTLLNTHLPGRTFLHDLFRQCSSDHDVTWFCDLLVQVGLADRAAQLKDEFERHSRSALEGDDDGVNSRIELIAWLAKNELDYIEPACEKHDISGIEDFLDLSDEVLHSSLGIEKIGDRKKLIRKAKEWALERQAKADEKRPPVGIAKRAKKTAAAVPAKKTQVRVQSDDDMDEQDE